jgi:predicted component of type VI protein secretion system
VALALLAATLAACRGPAPIPTPTAAPSPTPLPAATPVPTLDATTGEIQDAFLTNVNDLTSAVETLATAQCADLTAETRDNPTEVTEMRGFAATLRRIGASQPALDSDDVRSALADLGQALNQLDTALKACGITTP